jgi:hypothetical protein
MDNVQDRAANVKEMPKSNRSSIFDNDGSSHEGVLL